MMEMDAYTVSSLDAWMDRVVYPEQQDKFREFVTKTIDDDPDYEYSWTSLWSTFQRVNAK